MRPMLRRGNQQDWNYSMGTLHHAVLNLEDWNFYEETAPQIEVSVYAHIRSKIEITKIYAKVKYNKESTMYPTKLFIRLFCYKIYDNLSLLCIFPELSYCIVLSVQRLCMNFFQYILRT